MTQYFLKIGKKTQHKSEEGREIKSSTVCDVSKQEALLVEKELMGEQHKFRAATSLPQAHQAKVQPIELPEWLRNHHKAHSLATKMNKTLTTQITTMGALQHELKKMPGATAKALADELCEQEALVRETQQKVQSCLAQNSKAPTDEEGTLRSIDHMTRQVAASQAVSEAAKKIMDFGQKFLN